MRRSSSATFTFALFANSLIIVGVFTGCSSDDSTGAEGSLDANGDGVADGLGVLVDDAFDIDADGVVDGPGVDTDGDGVADAVGVDTNGDGIVDSLDTDGDGLVDVGGNGGDVDSGTGGDSLTATGGAASTPTGGTSSSGGGDSTGSGGTDASSGGSPASGGTGSSEGTGGDAPEPTGKCAPTKDWPAASTKLELEVLKLTNEVRAKEQNCGGTVMPPVGPLTMEPILACAARLHSKDMDARMFFAHLNPDMEQPNDRIWGLDYPGNAIGENIARGNAAAAATVQQWVNSPLHCKVMMNGDFTQLGVGYYGGGMFGHLWTQNFGG